MPKTINHFPTRSNINNLVQTIHDAIEIAQQHGVQCWLCYGALLGMVRENRLLPWNDDAELGCWYTSDINSKMKRITADLNKRGYTVYYSSAIGSLSVKKTGAVVNINCFWRNSIASKITKSENDSKWGPPQLIFIGFPGSL